HRRAASASLVTSCPATTARPEGMGMSVGIMRISVDLPPPVGPSKPEISPFPTLNLTPSTAVESPYFLTMFFPSIALGPRFSGPSHPCVATAAEPFVPEFGFVSPVMAAAPQRRSDEATLFADRVTRELPQSSPAHSRPWDCPIAPLARSF